MEVTWYNIVLTFVAFFVLWLVLVWGIEMIIRTPLIPRITDKHVLVTGCDTGFGSLVTQQLDRRGVRVFAACLTAKGQKDIESKTSERVVTLRLDVTSRESVQAAYEFVKSKLPKDKGLWGLVNNAGIANSPGLLSWCTRADYERVLQVNLIGVIDVTITFLPLLKKARGRVVNIASALSRVALGTGGYSESKYGVQAFSDTLRRESHALNYGIKVSILEPGFFKTHLTEAEKTRGELRASWDRLSPEQKEQYDENLVDELANAYINTMNFLSSPNLNIVTNAMIHGLLARYPKTRYSCGLDMKVIFVPLSYAPTWFTDTIFYWVSQNRQPPEEKAQRQ